MLTQGPAPDPKCELNITLFLTLPHPLHCPICAKDIMVVVLLLQVRGWLGVGSFVLRLGWGDRGGYHIFSVFCSVFGLLLIVLLWLVHNRLLWLFHCSFFAFFVFGPFH